MKQEMMQVVSQRLLATNIFEMTLRGSLVKEVHQPGQFFHIKPDRSDLILRRPISLASIDYEKDECVLIYRADGDGTKVLSKLKSGEHVDVLGPLGSGFPVDEITQNELVMVIGGGIGIPPLYEVAKQAKKRGAKVVSFLGFAKQDVMYYLPEFQKLGEVLVATDDGSYGEEGHLGLLLDNHLMNYQPQAVYACGALGLLTKVDQLFSKHPRAYISLEERMACGVGACYACVCHVQDEVTQKVTVKKVCDEGPVFPTGRVQL